MRVISKGQVTSPRDVHESMGIQSAETEIEFIQDENGRGSIAKAQSRRQKPGGSISPIRPVLHLLPEPWARSLTESFSGVNLKEAELLCQASALETAAGVLFELGM